MFDATMWALEKSLDLRMKAHELHTSNIANANVPDFKAKKIDFEKHMQEAVESLENKEDTMMAREEKAKSDIQSVKPDIYEDPMAPMSGDGNTVNMDREQTEIAKNTIAYEGAIQMLNRKFAMEKLVLTDGGGR